MQQPQPQPHSETEPSFSQPSWLARTRTAFSLDLRSIALFRVLLALVILWDLALRSQHLAAFYTDSGVLPREFWLQLTNPWHWSIHAASGQLWWQLLLFALASLFAFGLLIGYRTRLMAWLSFILLASLINRNALIVQGGDQLLVVMSFWSLFLPLNARWSVDCALQPELNANPNTKRFHSDGPQLYFSIATVAIVLQVLYLYVFTALLKTGDAWVLRFDAAFYAVSLDHMATPIAIWARQFPVFFTAATVYVLAVEFLAPILVLLPFSAPPKQNSGQSTESLLASPNERPIQWPMARIIGLLLLASLHLGFVFMMHIGLFPFIDFMALSLLIPSAVWMGLHQRQKSTRRYNAIRGITIYYDEDCGFCLKMCLILRELLLHPTVPIVTAQSDAAIHDIMLRNNSWVIKDANNTTYIHWHAMQFLFNQRWPFKPIAWIMKIKPLMTLGNATYRWVALNRGTMGNIAAWALAWRKITLRSTGIGGALAAFFLMAITIFNITGIPGYSQYRPSVIDAAIRVTRLDQKWDMFAPYPLTQTLFQQIPGKSRGGDNINLYPTTGLDPQWEPPTYLAPIHAGYRWRKYMGLVGSHKNNAVRSGFGHYLCNSYNANHPALSPHQLATFEIYTVKLRTNTSGEPQQRTRNRVWRHWCFGEFKPKA